MGTRDMTIRLHKGDLPNDWRWGDSVAIDTETRGLNPLRDRLCVVQLSRGDGDADLVHRGGGASGCGGCSGTGLPRSWCGWTW